MSASIPGIKGACVADNVRPVNEAIAGILGLDYDAFTQTVILPQGEFARFLRAEPKSQRGILQHLLRHDVFEHMRAEAERRRADVDAELRGVERELESYAARCAWRGRGELLASTVACDFEIAVLEGISLSDRGRFSFCLLAGSCAEAPTEPRELDAWSNHSPDVFVGPPRL